MYNATQKYAYINHEPKWSDATRDRAKAMLERVAPLEENFGKDICFFDSEQVREIALLISGTKADSADITWFKRYAKWCADNNIADYNSPLANIVTTVDTERYRRSMVSGPTGLKNALDKFLDPTTMETIDVVNRCAMWLAFCGIPTTHIEKIRKSNLDFDDLVIRYEGLEFPIYAEAFQAFKKAADLTEFQYHHPMYSEVIPRKRASGDLLIRGYDGSKCTLTRVKDTMRNTVVKAEERLGVSLGFDIHFNHIYYSGIFYRAYESERASGFEPTFTEDIKKIFTLDGTFDENREVVADKKRAWTRRFEKNYKLWKSVFGTV